MWCLLADAERRPAPSIFELQVDLKSRPERRTTSLPHRLLLLLLLLTADTKRV